MFSMSFAICDTTKLYEASKSFLVDSTFIQEVACHVIVNERSLAGRKRKGTSGLP